MFKTKKNIFLKDTDATGVLYFSQQLKLALEVFEEFLAINGLSLRTLIDERSFLLPIVHTEADFFAPIRVGDSVDIELKLSRLGCKSFHLSYQFYSSMESKLVGSAITVHVFISKESGQSIPIPQEFLSLLQKLKS
jgi:YbgC/YbaW family acyl-CoA thioester hydrolase